MHPGENIVKHIIFRGLVALGLTAVLAGGFLVAPVADAPGAPTAVTEQVGTAPNGDPMFEVDLEGVPQNQAEAGECTWSIVCGVVTVSGSSAYSVRVTYSWNDVYATDRYIPIGHRSSEYGKDADGIYVNAGYDVSCGFTATDVRVYRTTGWYKITDLDKPVCRRYVA
jgi:hypothetical protein